MKHTTQEELLRSAQFHPVFDPDGNISGIKELSVPSDRRLGMRAMEELAGSLEDGDLTISSDGWTGKQVRILKAPAPAAAHYLKPSRKYDAKSGDMVDSMTILLPYEVVWRLFELVFENQYSIEIKNVVSETEDVIAVKREMDGGENKDDAPGRIFYARAEVVITLHLANGNEKRYTGLGVAYDHVREPKMGNVFAINSARRTTEKGAVSDAKREAISAIGRVFRRAYEDGDEMVQTFEKMLLDKLRETNRPVAPARAAQATTVAAPTRKKPDGNAQAANKPAKQPEQPQHADEVPLDQFEEERGETRSTNYDLRREGKLLDQSDDPDIYFDRISDVLAEMEDVEAVDRILKENSDALKLAEASSKAGNTVAALRSMVIESLSLEEETSVEQSTAEEETPPEAEDTSAPGGLEITVEKKTGAAILDAYKLAFEKAKSQKDVDAILDANTELAKRLTNSQKAKLLGLAMQTKKNF